MPGETVTFPARLVVGAWTAWCTVRTREQSHRQLGMETSFRVVW